MAQRRGVALPHRKRMWAVTIDRGDVIINLTDLGSEEKEPPAMIEEGPRFQTEDKIKSEMVKVKGDKRVCSCPCRIFVIQ